MSEQLLEIDITKSHDENNDEDLLDFGIYDEKHLKVNFSKFISQSKYIRDKYKYSEAINSISNEISRFKKKMLIKENSIEHFLNYIQEGKVKFQYEEYHDMYKLSKHFEISRLTRELDEIFRSKW